MKRSTVKTVTSTACGVGASWLTGQVLLSFVPLPVQLPLRVLHFLGTTGVSSIVSRAALKAVRRDVDEVYAAVDAAKHKS